MGYIITSFQEKEKTIVCTDADLCYMTGMLLYLLHSYRMQPHDRAGSHAAKSEHRGHGVVCVCVCVCPCVYTHVPNVCPGTKCMKGGSVKLNPTG